MTQDSPHIELALETSEKRKIPNAQISEISIYELNQFADYEKKYGESCKWCSNPTPIYNCHGMTFASRRTGIFESRVIDQILKDDKYQLINPEDVLPGDIILYIEKATGDVEHSGIVISPPNENELGVPKVLSKWGKYSEILHWANRCPYDFSNVHYYRVMR